MTLIDTLFGGRRPATPTAPPPGSDRCRCCGCAVPRRRLDQHPFSTYRPEVIAPQWVTCPTCAGQPPDVLTDHALAALGIEHVGDDVARAAVARLPWRAYDAEEARLPDEHHVGPGQVAKAREEAPGRPSADPWAHLDPRAVRAAVAAAHAADEAAQRPRRPRRCTAGPCGACGVRTSSRWHTSRRFLPAIGTASTAPRWPLCAECEAIRLVVPGRMIVSENFRQRLTADFLDVEPSMSLPPLRSYAVVMGERGIRPADAEGCAERWGFITEEGRRNVLSYTPLRFWPQPERERVERLHAADERMRASERRRSHVFVDGADS